MKRAQVPVVADHLGGRVRRGDAVVVQHLHMRVASRTRRWSRDFTLSERLAVRPVHRLEVLRFNT